MDEMIQTINAHAEEAARKEAELAAAQRQEDIWNHCTTVALLVTAAAASLSFSMPGWMAVWLSHGLATVFGVWALLATGYYVGRGKR